MDPIRGTLRAECLDWTIILGRRHLERVLRTYIDHYNKERPHRRIGLRAPTGSTSPAATDLMALNVRRQDVLGALIHEYREPCMRFFTRSLLAGGRQPDVENGRTDRERSDEDAEAVR
jgi:Integrase core domain